MPVRTRNLVLAIAGTVAIPLNAFAIAATLLDGPDAVPATPSEVRIGEEAIPPGTVPGPGRTIHDPGAGTRVASTAARAHARACTCSGAPGTAGGHPAAAERRRR